MRSEELYNAWKDTKRQVDVGDGFADEVMDQLYRYEGQKRPPLFEWHGLIELVSAHPLAKVGLIAIGAVTGLVRIMFVVYAFLGC